MDGNQVAQVLMNEQPNLPVVISIEYFDDIRERLKWFAAALLRREDGPDTLLSTREKLVTSKKFPARRMGRTSEQLRA
jgi:hypothetical protein